MQCSVHLPLLLFGTICMIYALHYCIQCMREQPQTTHRHFRLEARLDALDKFLTERGATVCCAGDVDDCYLLSINLRASSCPSKATGVQLGSTFRSFSTLADLESLLP